VIARLARWTPVVATRKNAAVRIGAVIAESSNAAA
jgi:hypothetical protein